MHAAFTLSTVLLGSAVAVCAVVLLLLLPASRRRLANLWMQISGWCDAKLLRSHHEDLTVRAVSADTRMLSFLHISGPQYYAAQVLLGFGDAGLTYMSLQLWHLKPQVLPAVVVEFGLLGAWIGHVCGQAIYRRQRGFALLLGAVGLLYCCILGAMRYAFLMRHADGGGSLVNLTGSFGWPLVCMAMSIALGSQFRCETPAEQARNEESRAE